MTPLSDEQIGNSNMCEHKHNMGIYVIAPKQNKASNSSLCWDNTMGKQHLQLLPASLSGENYLNHRRPPLTSLVSVHEEHVSDSNRYLSVVVCVWLSVCVCVCVCVH